MANTQTNNKQTNTEKRITFGKFTPEDEGAESTIRVHGSPVGWIARTRSNFGTWQAPNSLVDFYEVVLHGSEKLGLNIDLERTFDVTRAGHRGEILAGDPSPRSVLGTAQAWARAALLVSVAAHELASLAGVSPSQLAQLPAHELAAKLLGR